MLAGCTKIGVDGTFKSCPELYSQLYIIMAWFMGQVMPAAYILLGGKKTTTYIRMIKELKLAVESIGLTFLPEFICLDFEAGAIKAFKLEFPFVKFLGCWFHYGQCLFKKISVDYVRVKTGTKKSIYGNSDRSLIELEKSIHVYI